MPVTLTKLPNGKVRVSTPNGVKAKATTPAKAKHLRNLLNALDHNPHWKPK
jgi:translation initiation factor IF-1